MNTEKVTFFWRVFSKRTIVAFFILCFGFLLCVLRVYAVTDSGYAAVAENNSRLTIDGGMIRGTIYDCNMNPITNNQRKILAAVSPTPRAITAISAVLEGDEKQQVLEMLKSGKPVVCEVPEMLESEGIVCTVVYTTDKESFPAAHLIGYTDADGHGVTGLEAAFDSLLRTDERVTFSFAGTGLGQVLSGIEPTVSNSGNYRANAVVTTLDINIQNIAEDCADSLESGAIVIAEAKSGKIRGCVSRPNFDINKISDYLNAQNSPLLNRAVNAYNVGSVFKPCVAAAGIEKLKDGFLYSCSGNCKIADRVFNCHNRKGHGFLRLDSALANSCNTYFFNFAFKMGPDAVYNMATSLKFGTSLSLCDGIATAAGNLPDKTRLDNIAELANTSIGQGGLLLSPVSMLTLYCAIATDGKYTVPSLVEGTIKNGEFEAFKSANPSRAMEAATAAELRRDLAAVITEGTGVDAKPQTTTAAGKTATAQTGKFIKGVEICSGWFCGFFPLEDPEYVVIVFSEDTRKQSLSCSKIFALIADKITEFKGGVFN